MALFIVYKIQLCISVSDCFFYINCIEMVFPWYGGPKKLNSPKILIKFVYYK